jgi:hypothetical protein
MKYFAIAILVFASFLISLPSSAEMAKDLVGTWQYTVNETTNKDGSTVDTYGKIPKGLVMFDAGGHFSLFIAKSDPAKFASNNRLHGTSEEYKAAVYNAIAYYGTYKVDQKTKTLSWTIEASTFPNWYGVTQTRQFSVNGDELRFTNKAGSSGGSVLAVLKRLH